MKPLTRRKALALAAVAPAAVALAPVPASASSELSALIEKHKAAYKVFIDAIDRCSPLEEVKVKTGTTTRALAKAEREVDRAGSAEMDLFYELCEFRPQSLEDAKIKAEYMLTTYIVKDMWDQDATAFLQSFA